MPDLGVRKATAADVDVLALALARAFYDDPVFRWVLPDDARRRTKGQVAYRLFLERLYLPKDEVYTDAGRRGAALWSPPGKWRTPVGTQLRSAPHLLRLLGRRAWTVTRGLADIERAHPDEVPHWYLGVLGTDPAAQGMGIGSAVMAPVLERCDREGVPAYLESSKDANIPYYRRHGFEMTETITLPDGPAVWGMWREPRDGAQWREPRGGEEHDGPR